MLTRGRGLLAGFVEEQLGLGYKDVDDEAAIGLQVLFDAGYAGGEELIVALAVIVEMVKNGFVHRREYDQ